MKTLMLTATTVALLASGTAYADPDNNNGNQGCDLLADSSEHKNPGKMMQHVREISEGEGFDANQNVVEWLANFPGFDGNVGDWIRRNCKELN